MAEPGCHRTVGRFSALSPAGSIDTGKKMLATANNILTAKGHSIIIGSTHAAGNNRSRDHPVIHPGNAGGRLLDFKPRLQRYKKLFPGGNILTWWQLGLSNALCM